MKAKTIMIQGTMSNSGKSLVVGGLCRIFKQDGHKVAPFKSQNMALNSFITEEGMEMGRAQVVQAEAAGVAPHVDMNPILLKPTSDCGSQVIVNGKSMGNMRAAEYFAYKRKLIPEIMSAFNNLSEEYDIIAIEGAGSPAEINLKQEDIVNMGMAKMADAPVLLVGDIDRGGVFASLYGTVALLEPEERERIKGIIINKFRGDVEILKPGLKMLEELTGIPVVGVIPYAHLDIDDEDSLSERIVSKASGAPVDIAVIRLPRMSNFTDFGVFEHIEQVGIRYVQKVADLGQPDLIILPGTKNTMGDLKWLRESGIEAEIKKYVASGNLLIGICGGYQMLGQELSDPEEFEEGGHMQGMGILPTSTVFEENKVRTQVTGRVKDLKGAFSCLSGCKIAGYEIHMGRTASTATAFSQIVCAESTSEEGAVQDNVLGTYIHGIFDSTEVCTKLVKMILEKKGLFNIEISDPIDYEQYKQIQYDKLADLLRNGLDMNKIYEILGG